MTNRRRGQSIGKHLQIVMGGVKAGSSVHRRRRYPVKVRFSLKRGWHEHAIAPGAKNTIVWGHPDLRVCKKLQLHSQHFRQAECPFQIRSRNQGSAQPDHLLKSSNPGHSIAKKKHEYACCPSRGRVILGPRSLLLYCELAPPGRTQFKAVLI